MEQSNTSTFNNEERATQMRGLICEVMKNHKGEKLEEELTNLLMSVDETRLKEVGFLNYRLSLAMESRL